MNAYQPHEKHLEKAIQIVIQQIKIPLKLVYIADLAAAVRVMDSFQ